MVTIVYLTMFALGALLCWLLYKTLHARYWFILILIALSGYMVHGFILDPEIGYPPWQDNERTDSSIDAGLFIRAISWFSYSLTIAGVVFGVLLVARNRANRSSSR